MTNSDLGLWGRERLLEALDAYSRGLSDAPLLHKWTKSDVTAVDDDRDQPMSFIISTDDVDRHGDVIVAEGVATGFLLGQSGVSVGPRLRPSGHRPCRGGVETSHTSCWRE